MTTIQISEETVELLKMYNEQWKLENYDEVIKKFMSFGDYAKSFRGYLGKMSRKELIKDLRDKKLLKDKKIQQIYLGGRF
ncbi:MAG TPA: hypothetical protein VJG30_03040 [Candidatus Nanoarchaeia archaeon]|nr:hypothetical protein [Candidatus Nanoarchaeia archaeon]